MLVQLPGGTAIDAQGDIVAAQDNGEIVLHTQQALARVIEFWKNKPNLTGLMSDYIDEIQDLENAIWDVIVLRMLPYAANAQLDTLGKLVGQPRNSMGDAQYRVWINARIAINRSNGTPNEIIAILRMIESSRFRYSEFGAASARVDYLEPTSTESATAAIPPIVAIARVGGVNTKCYFPVDAVRGAMFRSFYDSSVSTQQNLYSSIYAPSSGSVWGHASNA